MPRRRVGVFCPHWTTAPGYDAARPSASFRQPERFLWPTRRGRSHRGVARSFDAEVVLFGATYRSRWSVRARGARLPYLTAAHGFEYWLSLAPGTHSVMRYATSRARACRCCARVHRADVRTAVPAMVPVTVLYPGADVERFRPRPPRHPAARTGSGSGAWSCV
jgi:hypothetical protein